MTDPMNAIDRTQPVPSDQSTATAPQIALLFPGQGSQTVGMGRAFYDTVPAAKAVFDEADDVDCGAACP